MHATAKAYDTAEKRWAGVGPYYAMFPTDFADDVIEKYTRSGDTVLDPFAGRGTAVFSAATQGRIGIGIEVNPVGWVYGNAKLSPAVPEAVLRRVKFLASKSSQHHAEAIALPEFFHLCFSQEIRAFLLSARANLDWQNKQIDCTVMAFLLIYLHGKYGQALSNQMRQTKSMSPPYAIKWWRERGLQPPELDPVEFMEKRVVWRYAKGLPKLTPSTMVLGNCVESLPRLRRDNKAKSARLLFTSPPYCGVANYHYDQWLRLWLLGYAPVAHNIKGENRGRFCNREAYVDLLVKAFSSAAQILAQDAVIYIRTDSRNFTHESTLKVLREMFPHKNLIEVCQPFSRPTQTHLYGDKSKKKGEIDLILKPH